VAAAQNGQNGLVDNFILSNDRAVNFAANTVDSATHLANS
jgi:hypothetical protein